MTTLVPESKSIYVIIIKTKCFYGYDDVTFIPATAQDTIALNIIVTS